jgi:hypothetical protein
LKTKIPVKELLCWRLEKATAEAPPAPAAASLLALARPWWETSPARFQSAIQKLNSIPSAQAHSICESGHLPASNPMPTLILRTAEEQEASLRMLSIGVKNGRMQLSFQFETVAGPEEQEFELTFVSELTSKPLFRTHAAKSASGEYWLEAELPSELAENWKRLKVTDRLPFRLILRLVATGV